MKNTDYICPNCSSLDVDTTNKSELTQAIKNDELVSWHTVAKQEYNNQHSDICDCKQCFVFSCNNCEYVGYTIKYHPDSFNL